MSHSAVRRIVLIGLDGATWDVIDPMVKRGLLPNIQKFIKSGVRANLKSLKVTFSPRVWTSIATGKTEEKHGIFNFKNNISDLKAIRIWDILASKGEKVNIFYWYLTWPPRKDINGFVVPGFLARDNRTVPKDLSFLKEIELSEKMKVHGSGINTGMGSYIKKGYRAFKYGVKFSTLIRAINYLLTSLVKKYDELDSFNRLQLLKLYLFSDVFTHILKKNPIDFAAIMFPQPDQLGHKFWAFMEPEEFEKRTSEHVSEEDRKKYGNVIYDCYSALDKSIGEICNNLSQDDIVIALSDHGFGLVERSLASLKIKGDNFLKIFGLDKIANCFSSGINFVIKMDNDDSNVDLSEISKEISEIKTIDDNKPLFKVTHDQHEIVLELSDIFSMYLDDACEFLKKKIKMKDQIFPVDEILVNRSDITGEHRDIGVLLMRGANIKKGITLDEASVLDIVPTILYLKNLPIAQDMDGVLLKDAITDDYINNNPEKYIETYESKESKDISEEDTDFSMTDELESRLKDLGYLD